MRDYIRGLLGPVGRTNGWQLAEHAGHRTPDHLQRLLNRVRWKADELRDGLQHYVAERLSEPGGILILDDTASSRRAPPPPACSTSTPGPPAAPRTARSVSTPPTPPHADAPWWTGFIAADAAAKGAAEMVPASRPSPWQKFGGSWQLSPHPLPLARP
ncbi:transposase [Streptomyces ossamyceticus]|uniref:transposase n=1 Tax=Streptomyces TaxID=1883 RepID=UPI000A625B3C|nr:MULTISPECIES: transposase [Streptomyces]MCL6737978.1 transposase [Streptomyces neyagawaensis]MDE1688283.1 transposase [Streptomyces neyagawaensis]MDG5809335.1 transposase [Streptomyces ossamyceticus]